MTREEFIREWLDDCNECHEAGVAALDALLAAERERCAKICEELAASLRGATISTNAEIAAEELARRIREGA